MWRLDKSGFWSHKAGDGLVTYLTDAGLPIRDPQDDLGQASDFVGYFLVTARTRARLAGSRRSTRAS